MSEKRIPPPEPSQYEHLTHHLEYLNDKIIEASTQFITLATAIIGGAFYLRLNTPQTPTPAAATVSLPNTGPAVSLLLLLVSIGAIHLILNNLRAWKGYRDELSKRYDVDKNKGRGWWISEVGMCLLIVLTCTGFLYFNPLGTLYCGRFTIAFLLLVFADCIVYWRLIKKEKR